MSLSMLAKSIGSDYQGCDPNVSGISIDTRTLEKGQLFVAIKGERFDGHDYLLLAQQKGAVAAMVSEKVNTDLPCLEVKDTLDGLQLLAANWRNKFDLPLIAVTGSNGKTTVKELIGSILTEHFNEVLITAGNLNNHIGVPLTLLRLNKQHKCAVIEMGMNHPGEISSLTRLAKPDVALVNNAMLAHVEAFDSVLDVAAAKSEIFQGLSSQGIAVLNADDPNYDFFKKQAGSHQIIDFGLKASAMVSAELSYRHEHIDLFMKTPAGSVEVNLNLLGQHNAMNALAATACGLALDIDLVSIKNGLEKVVPVKGRLQPLNLSNGVIVLNDTYNANPDSMKAGIDVLVNMPASKRILVVGDMGELGEQGPQLHRQIGEYAAAKNIDAFLSLGSLMNLGAKGFGLHGFNTHRINELIERLCGEIEKDCIILVKGSRSMRMERVVDSLLSNDVFTDNGGQQ